MSSHKLCNSLQLKSKSQANIQKEELIRRKRLWFKEEVETTKNIDIKSNINSLLNSLILFIYIKLFISLKVNK